MTIADLIVRLKKATEPDRELDLEIGEAVGAANHSGPASHRPFRDWAKHYTASIDAALTLVPKDGQHPWSWRVGNTPSGRGFAYIGTSQTECDGATPAIALCIAALKARAAVTASDRGKQTLSAPERTEVSK